MIAKKQIRTPRSAFTLMEVLVVAAILVVLAGAGGMIYMRFLDQSKIDRAKMDVKTLSTAASAFEVTNGRPPTTLAELAQQQPDGGKPYVEQSALTDPWLQPYQFAFPGQHHTMSGRPDIWSQGPRSGDPSGIIGNWQN